ncbi:MAG: response regulator, partial [Gammaproteobacteria bacterium]|nr:response regulator [Gammaproteobacteria bacterium]
VRLDVCDTGCGMTNDTKDHAFEPFFTTKKNGKGTGMGLAAVYGTLVNHGGGIVINSQPEEGTCFSLFFKSSDQQPEETIDEKQSLPKGKVSILLVDDEELIRNYTQELFEQYDYQIKTCANGLEAIKFFSQSKDNIDLVILDMMMPQMGGRETFHQLKLIDPDVKVIVASGYGADEEVQTMLNDGVVDFIQKPFTMESLSKILQKVLNF